MTIKFPIVNTMVRAIRQPMVSVPQILWVPNLLGAQYGQLTVPWVPSGVDFDLFATYFATDISGTPIVISSAVVAGFHLKAQSNGSAGLNMSSLGGPSSTTLASEALADVLNTIGYDSNSELFLANSASASSAKPTSADIQNIGKISGNSNFMVGQIHSVKLTDPLDGVVNGRDVVELDGVDQYGTVPTWTYTNGDIEFDFIINSFATSNTYIIDFSPGLNTIFIVDTVTKQFEFINATVELDGVALANLTVTAELGRVYRVKITSTVAGSKSTAPFIGAFNGLTANLFLPGFIANLSLTDTDDSSNSRFYKMDTLELVDDLHPVEDSPELVVNGTFDTDTTGWVEYSDSTLEWVDGQLKLTAILASVGVARQEDTVYVAGVTYKISVEYENSTSTNVAVWIGNSGPGSANLHQSPLLTGSGVYTAFFIGAGGATQIQLVTQEVDTFAFFDNVSIKETTEGTWFNDPTLTARANNSLDLNFAIRSVDVPTETNIFDQNGNVVGAWNNLDGSDPYVPLLTE